MKTNFKIKTTLTLLAAGLLAASTLPAMANSNDNVPCSGIPQCYTIAPITLKALQTKTIQPNCPSSSPYVSKMYHSGKHITTTAKSGDPGAGYFFTNWFTHTQTINAWYTCTSVQPGGT